VAARRRTTGRSSARAARRRRPGALALPSLGPGWRVSPAVVRSLVALALLVVGAVTLIALALPGEGTLTTWWRDVFAPWFGTGRWILPFVLLAAGVFVERSAARSGWPLTLLAGTVAYAGALGFLELLHLPDRSGGRIGAAVSGFLVTLLGPVAAGVVLVAITIAALLVVFDRDLGSLVAPVGRGLAILVGVGRGPGSDRARGDRPVAGGRRRTTTPSGGTTGWREEEAIHGGPVRRLLAFWPRRSRPATTRSVGEAERPIPEPVPGPGPLSATLAGPAAESTPLSSVLTPPVAAPREAALPAGRAGIEEPAPPETSPDAVTDAGDAAPRRDEPPYALPPITLLDDVATRSGGVAMDHERNAAIIVAKLASFNIPARVVRWNAGPVVTQYEVEPDPAVKVSRIEALADDLAMALAARTIRIEAPIPGKSVVGIEIPNTEFNVVSLRRILEEVDFRGTGSKLTFALGRDVAGHGRAADLAKMPHLLIAGATGSGKSVMVNAMITSMLMNATPDDVRFILVDLKRVELAAYNELPHLLVPVITEPERAKAALRWAVGEMEARYRRFAAAGARNLAGYNESRVDPADRLPFIVIIVDELADLMMREGKNIEDPIVRLAQKARATGIHLVLATQRPSVNVVTGLIKANFPSRIAFAMASQVDSRTILDAPGAEDLIGRGDMLFQPADLPRPIRLQGVFVSDREIRAVTEYWRSWHHHYDLSIVAGDDEGGEEGEGAPDGEADRLLPEAIEVIREYDRASASLLQRRLRIGYARAARIIDQLEARGYIGPYDGSNARVVLRRDGGGSPRTNGEGDG
jgi:hypothetical protein